MVCYRYSMRISRTSANAAACGSMANSKDTVDLAAMKERLQRQYGILMDRFERAIA